MDSLVDARWLEGHAGAPSLHILDASWHLPGTGRDARSEFRAGHLPGAAFFDIDRIADRGSELPHMLPDAADFAREVGSLGIDNDSAVVIYDTHGLFGAARAWWMFRVFGHERVAILDGGLAAWKALELPLETGEPECAPATVFAAGFRPRRVRTLGQVRRNIESMHEQLLDARPPGRFRGTQPEPRPGLRAGHVPGARNVPGETMIDPLTRRVRSPARLASAFPDLDARPVVCSCGTGVAACALAFGLYRLGRDDVSVYDGSWTEWAGRGDTPVETGPAKTGQDGDNRH